MQTVTMNGGGFGLIPDWQFYPAPPPIGTGQFEETTIDLPGACPSMGICGAMGLGQDDAFVPGSVPTDTQMKYMAIGAGVIVLHSLLRVPLAITSGVHGYKRNEGSAASALGWGTLGFIFPFTTTVVALIQGYGRRKS